MTANKDSLEKIAKILMEKEVITGDELFQLISPYAGLEDPKISKNFYMLYSDPKA